MLYKFTKIIHEKIKFDIFYSLIFKSLIMVLLQFYFYLPPANRGRKLASSLLLLIVALYWHLVSALFLLVQWFIYFIGDCSLMILSISILIINLMALEQNPTCSYYFNQFAIYIIRVLLAVFLLYFDLKQAISNTISPLRHLSFD